MNLADFGPGHWIPQRLPDGRTAVIDAVDPANATVAAAARRINQAGVRDQMSRWPGAEADYAVVASWLDEREPLPVPCPGPGVQDLLFDWPAEPVRVRRRRGGRAR